MWLCVLLGFQHWKGMGLRGHRRLMLEAAGKREPKSSPACELAWVFVKKTSQPSWHSVPLGVSSRQVVLGLCGLSFSLFRVFSVLTLKVSGFISLRKVEFPYSQSKLGPFFWNFILAVQELFCSCREQELLAGCRVWLLTVVASLVQSMGSGHAGFSVAVYGLSSCGSWALEHRLSSCGEQA